MALAPDNWKSRVFLPKRAYDFLVLRCGECLLAHIVQIDLSLANEEMGGGASRTYTCFGGMKTKEIRLFFYSLWALLHHITWTWTWIGLHHVWQLNIVYCHHRKQENGQNKRISGKNVNVDWLFVLGYTKNHAPLQPFVYTALCGGICYLQRVNQCLEPTGYE